jgi:diguanylate cyclase (GGDEF)-like protein/PAS domain S-box-containing protein
MVGRLIAPVGALSHRGALACDPAQTGLPRRRRLTEHDFRHGNQTVDDYCFILKRASSMHAEREAIADALYEQKERAEVTLACIADGVVCTDVDGKITFLNSAAEVSIGWTLAEAEGRPMFEIFRTRGNSDSNIAETTSEVAILQIRDMRMPSSCVLIQRDGREITIEESIAPINNRQGLVTGAVIVFRDVSAAREMATQMAYAAQHDFLTGLPNRMLLSDRIGQAISVARRNSTRIAVLFLDVDGFKHVNDSLGHTVGDQLLQSIAQRLSACVGAINTVSRQGGDEFVVLVPALREPSAAAVMAGRILKALALPHSVGRHDLHITTSIGVSTFPEDGLNAEELIKSADTAMFQAKNNARHSFQFFTPAMNTLAVERQHLEEGLRRALSGQQLALHYQPKVCLRTGAIIGAEALLRWTHPMRGLVPPATFIPIAEDSGVIVAIGQWVLHEACRQIKAWAAAGLPVISVAVNVSAMEFRATGFPERVCTTLQQMRVDPRNIELELTESVLMRHIETTALTLKVLRRSGLQVSIDDFGTGYSSLSYLWKLSVDKLKIDQSFVRQIAAGGDGEAIVTAIVSMARSLKLKVVAEGVETRDQAEFLRGCGCDEAQGYYFGRPMQAHEFATFYAQRSRARAVTGASHEQPASPLLAPGAL